MVRAINKISISIIAAGPKDHTRLCEKREGWEKEREKEDRRAILTPLFRGGLAA